MRALTGQVTVALAIIGALALISVAAMVTAYFVPGIRTEALMLASGAGGSLATALNSPTGIASAIAEMKRPDQAAPPTPLQP
jgi:hypothetical protein